MERTLIVLKIISLIYALILLPTYIYLDIKFEKIRSLKSKLALSTSFCCVGLIGATLNDFSISSVLILFGLILSLIGDYYLIFIEINTSKFIKGILAFGLSLVFYIASMYSVTGFTFWNLLIGAFIYILFLYFINKKIIRFGAEKYPLYIYSMVLIMMTIKSISMLYSSPFALQSRLMFASGALLFFISDIFLGINVYIKKKTIFKILNNATYFIGQYLIAASLIFTYL